VWSPYPLDRQLGEVACLSLSCGYYNANSVKVTVIDVADLASPRVQQEYDFPGYYSSSRRIGSSVRLVLSDNFRWPNGIQWGVYSSDPALYQDPARLAAAYDELIARNEKVIRAAALSDWLPPAKRTLEDGTTIDVGYDCRDFNRSNAPTRLGLVTVATLNLDSPDLVSRTSVVAEAGEVYASASHLYVANRHWWWWPEPGQTDYTYLHKFAITDPDRAVYVASGGVDGHIVDQFSMDEDAQGYFRVATTLNTRVEDAASSWGRVETTNRVSVLGERNGVLEVVGRTPDFASGERIYSSRFIEDKGFVVTFRQIDPLFTLDLRDPAAPRIVGELKIPGFSTYMHPLDATHLLTIGTYIDEQNTWSTRSLQLAIFDVSDLAHPSKTFTQTVGTAYGWSEAQSEHKAFNYFPARKLLAIPFFDYPATPYWDWGGFVSDLRVFEVEPATGFTAKGAVSMKDVYASYNDWGWSYYWAPYVRRSVMADQFVYAISDSGIRVADVAALSRPLATVTFQKSMDAGMTGK
ncbi:MAG TPA: beta-propeller domain-containing protein, partial [Myxococcaceae bacterium]|nr:beta-propeller domain-containing protein [Myxococcaceae bacterium]